MFGRRKDSEFGADNPALKLNHDGSGHEILQWIVGAVLGLLILYWIIGFAANQISRHISDASEVKWSRHLESVMFPQLQISENEKNSPEFLRAKALLDQMVRQQKLRKLQFRLLYSESPLPNAFALPGGSVAVTGGLLSLVKGDMGLAMVLAHELGHHQHRDPLRGMGRSMILSIFAATFLGGQSGFTRLVLRFANSSYSREQELSADAFGLRLVRSVFGKTEGAYEFFEKIAQEKNLGDTKLMSMFSTHPYTPDRLDALKALDKSLRPH